MNYIIHLFGIAEIKSHITTSPSPYLHIHISNKIFSTDDVRCVRDKYEVWSQGYLLEKHKAYQIVMTQTPVFGMVAKVALTKYNFRTSTIVLET